MEYSYEDLHESIKVSLMTVKAQEHPRIKFLN